MGKRLAALLMSAVVLAAAPSTAGDKPKLTDAGVYSVTYEVDGTGSLKLKTIRLTQATQRVVARPGVAFGVCCQQLLIKGQRPQAGYLRPEDTSSKARFWGVETDFSREGSGPRRFYGFVFEKGSRPVPGTYAVNLYRADDGSLLARQVFEVVGEKAAASSRKGQRPAPGSGE
jgi:hypothetical protein